MKIYITIIIYLILISSCSTYYTDDELTKLSNNLLQKIQDIEDSLEKTNKDYIIFHTCFAGSTQKRNRYLVVFVKEKDGYYIGTKYNIFRKYQGKSTLIIDKQIEDLIKCINKDTINFKHDFTLDFLYTINMKYKSKNYLFTIFESSPDLSKNKCVVDFLEYLKSKLFEIEIQENWY